MRWLRDTWNRYRSRREWSGKGRPRKEVLDAIEQMSKTPSKFGPLEFLEFGEDGKPLPPWEAFPEIARFSIGWRMGGGEDYWRSFVKWFRSMKLKHQQQYQASHPATADWEDFYELIGNEK